MDIQDIIVRIYPISVKAQERLMQHIRVLNFPKGHVLMQANRVERRVFFIKKGIVRAYAHVDSREVTFWFGKEGDAVISMKSYILQQPGYEDIELLEDALLYEIDIDALQNLYQTDIEIANWGRKLAEVEIIKTEERQIAFQCQTAAQRYQHLLSFHPHLLQRVALSHIASYLGITQVSLSRIRAELK